MTAYIIADVTVTDPKQFAEYHRLSGAAFEAHGIKPLAAVGTTERLEGLRTGTHRPFRFDGCRKD